jgi:uncharacterized protein YecT (DUF1311 family)
MRIGTLASLVAAGALALAVAGPPSPTGGRAEAASFNCALAASRTEIAICGDPGLSSLDSAIGVAYQQRLALDPALRQIQRGWLKARDVGCGRDRGCLRAFMSSELAMLRSGGRPSGRIPISVGSCGLSTVKLVGSRLEGSPGSGSAIGETDGAMQISYDEIPQIDASRRGDPVLVCLASLPSDCPPGDDRGKVYAAANLRTLGAWSAPDSEHSCGGA